MNITEHLLFEPQHFSVPAPWAGHIPFAHWLIGALRPRTFVELGAYSGISYMSFCQSIVAHQCTTRAWAVDTWQGDPHAGYYNDSVYSTLKDKHDPLYSSFSRLVRSTFDAAVDQFEDGSIDLLHIDGLHTYEAVKHDFETWRQKLSGCAVVLLHDTCVFRDDFGVHQLWAELETQFPSINFTHSNGLGVLLVGAQQPSVLLELCKPNAHEHVLTLFARAGERFEARANGHILAQQLKDLQALYDREVSAGQTRHAWIEKLDQQIRSFQDQMNAQNEQARRITDSLERELADVYASRSWRLTYPLRRAGHLARRSKAIFSRFHNALAYLRRGDFRGFIRRTSALLRNQQPPTFKYFSASGQRCRIGVLTSPHTLFLSRFLARRLQHHGFSVEISTTQPKQFDLDLYFVLTPQVFKRLPPGEKRIVYQLEQSISDRWFTAEYLRTLNESVAVLDYCQDNLEFLASKGIAYPHVFYLPVGAYPQTIDGLPKSPEYDVVFYGDAHSSERRRSLLKILQKHYKVDVVSEVFGDALTQRLRNAKLAINLHYYEHALLETPRLHECLSLGVPVVSESASNQSEFAALRDVVRFFETGSEEAMLDAVARTLAAPPSSQQIAAAAHNSEILFNFHFDRVLLALGLLQHQDTQNLPLALPANADRICLSLPETTLRRKQFLSKPPLNCVLFDGFRASPGWVGCGLSYRHLARHALQQGIQRLTVMEDDVLLPEHFESSFTQIQNYLDERRTDWDIFAGMIAALHPDTQVISVEQADGLTFVTLNKMTSMVFNIYNRRALELLSRWNPLDTHSDSNTIDRYIERQLDLKVVVTLPFYVEHREDTHSTLWGFHNTQYAQMILQSEQQLRQLVAEFLQRQN